MREGKLFLGGGPGGHACGFLFNFSKVTENANNNKAILIFFHIQGCQKVFKKQVDNE